MKKRRLKKQVIYLGIALCLLVVVSMYFITERSLNKKEEPINNDYVNKTIFENNIPVVVTKEVMIRPYTDNTVKIVRNYYNKDDDEQTQQQSLIYFENTYIPSTGISYKSDYNFDVIAVLDGIVLTVKEDQTLGKIVEIKHNDNVISTYQSLSEVLINEGDEIKQGMIIGKSGNSNLQADLGSHLHFELTVNSHTVDPEEYYDKELEKLN